MKVFALGTHGFVTAAVADILDINKQHRQARVLVAARSKAEAFSLLGTLRMAPGSISDPNFRTAMGDDVDVLGAAGLFDAPAVFALRELGGGPVVRLEAGGPVTVVGRIGRVGDGPLSPMQFVPTPAGVDGPVWTEPMTLAEFVTMMELRTRGEVYRVADACHEAAMGIADDPTKWDARTGRVLPGAVAELIAAAEAHLEQEELQADDFAGQCRANVARVKELNEQLAAARTERLVLAHTAVQRGLISEAERAFGVSGGRIYQLNDEYLVAETNRRRQKLAATGR